jgi:hypothetical protein
MEPGRIRCSECLTPVRESELNQGRLSKCSGCGNFVQVEIFPAYFRKAAPGQQAEILMVEGEAACFYHPNKKAVIPCHSCGRFLCGLCDCDLNGEHFCAPCLEAGKRKGKIKSIEDSRVRYDSMALLLAVVPMIVFYLTFITAPVALFIAIRRWNAPRSMVHNATAGFVTAMVIATLQLIGWGLVIFVLVVGLNG